MYAYIFLHMDLCTPTNGYVRGHIRSITLCTSCTCTHPPVARSTCTYPAFFGTSAFTKDTIFHTS